MASYTMGDVSDSISDISGYILYAEGVPGSNGDTTGLPTYNLGTDPSDASMGYNIWDPDASIANGFDTESSNFDLDAGLDSGSNALSVQSAASISYNSAGSQSVGALKIRAAARIPGIVSWTSLTFEFYQGSSIADSLTLSQGPAVDTTPSSSSGVAEQVLTVTPSSSSTPYSRVTVAATIRMHTDAGSLPGSNDLACQVFVMPPA